MPATLRKQGSAGLGGLGRQASALAAASELQEGAMGGNGEDGSPTVALAIGDVVYLSCVGGAVNGGIVHAEGFADCRVGLLPPDGALAAGGGGDGGVGAGAPAAAMTPEQLLRGAAAQNGMDGAEIGPHAGLFKQEAHFQSCLFRVTNCCQYAAQENYRRHLAAEAARAAAAQQQLLQHNRRAAARRHAQEQQQQQQEEEENLGGGSSSDHGDRLREAEAMQRVMRERVASEAFGKGGGASNPSSAAEPTAAVVPSVGAAHHGGSFPTAMTSRRQGQRRHQTEFLKERAQREVEKNLAMLTDEAALGRPVHYGEVIQLQVRPLHFTIDAPSRLVLSLSFLA